MKKVELNLIDKAVAFFNPNAAVERLASRAKLTKFEYDATLYNRQRRVPSQLQGAEGFRSNYDRVEMMKRARDLDQNFGLVRSLLLKFATHVAANITYQARTTDQNVNSDVEAYWNSWWDKCDLSGRHTGSILMQIATMSMLRDGDFFFILVRDQDGNLRLQGVEADRIGDPFRTYTSLNLIGGIHINQETGAPDGYDVYLRTFGNAYMFQATIAANQVFHLYDPLRIDQYRGVTAFCTAINDATDIYEIVQMEKMAAKIASSQGGIIKRTNNNASDLANLTNDLDSNNQTIKIESIEPGRITYLEPGEEMQFPDSPNRPGNGFQEFHKILLRNICMGVGIPYSFAVDPSAMSGPTARLEMQQASRTFKRHQKLLEDKVLRPVKNIVIADGIARGLIKNNVGTKTTKGVFNFGASVSIDLGRESASAIAEFKSGLRTAADIYSERGLDFESSIQQRARETKMITDLAEKYNIPATAISDILATATFAQAQTGGAMIPQKEPSPTQGNEQPPEEDSGDQSGSEDVPPIKPQDTETGKYESGGDGDIDVGEGREPTEKGAVENLPTGSTREGKLSPKVPSILETLDTKSLDMLANALETLSKSRKKRNTLSVPDVCPVATQDIPTNLANRKTAVDDANYGPANPNEPNEDYWKAKAGEFQGDVATAKKMLCGNCAAFNQTKKLLGCISKGIGEDAGEVEMGGDLGYCEIFDFKCAAKRTCDAWIVGGPITDNKIDKKA